MTEGELLTATEEEMMEFIAEVKEVKSKKLASMDISYRVILETDDPKVLALGVLDADKLLKVLVEESSGN